MSLYSIEGKDSKRSYYIANDTKSFIDMVTTDLAKEKKIKKKDAKKNLKNYNLSRYNKEVEVPIIDEESLYHNCLKANDIIKSNQNYIGYVGYALMDQYYFEL